MSNIWCEDHISAAKEFCERWKQYQSHFKVAKKYKARRNIGRPGETWIRKGEITLGFKRYETAEKLKVVDIVIFSGHARFRPDWSIGWCVSRYPTAFEEVK